VTGLGVAPWTGRIHHIPKDNTVTRQTNNALFQGPTLGRRPGDEPVTVFGRRPPAPAAPTAEDRLESIDGRLDRLEGMVRDALDRLDGLAARLDKDA
jgi:hypothetical protein